MGNLFSKAKQKLRKFLSQKHPKLRKTAGIVWDGFVMFANAAEKFTDGTPAKIPLAALNIIIDIATTVSDNDSDVKELVEQINVRLEIIVKSLRDPTSDTARDRCLAFIQRLNEIGQKATALENRNIFARIAQAKEDSNVLKDLLADLSRATENFQVDVCLAIERNTDDLTQISGQLQLDSWLTQEAMYGTVKSNREYCTPGTRTSVLKRIKDWADDTSLESPQVFWLSGLAGTGKSTIAYTIARDFAEQKPRRLGGSFFCSRQLSEARLRHNIIPTIASLLAEHSSTYRKVLAQQRVGPNLQRPDMQIPSMLITPWKAAAHPPNLPPLLIVIDALDELDAEGDRSGGAKFIEQLIRHISELRGLKFLITSRPEPDVVQRCQMLQPETFTMEEIDSEHAQSDVRTYLSAALASVGEDDLIAQLAAQSNGLFIYAVTAVRFIKVTGVQQVKRLKQICQEWPKPEQQGRDGLLLDKAYYEVLRPLLDLPQTDLPSYLSVLHTIVCAQEPLAISSIKYLLETRDTDDDADDLVMDAVSNRLFAVLRVDSEGRVYTYHQSFLDFILDAQRSNDFACKAWEQHFVLARRCFGLMKAHLRFNVCTLPSSFLKDSEVDGLKEKVDSMIKAPLLYAMRRWGFHTSHAFKDVAVRESKNQEILYVDLRDFCDTVLLFWIEAMSLVRTRGDCADTLRNVRQSLEHHTENDQFNDLAKDIESGERLSITFASNTVAESTPHLYISILATFDSSASPLIERWKAKFPGLARLTGQRAKERLLTTISVHTSETEASEICAMDVSPDTKLIALAIKNRIISLWDAATGTEMLQLEGHSDWVTSVSFSHDGKKIVSASRDMTVRVWDTVTGKEGALFEGHSAHVNSASFSFDRKLVVSASDDKTLRVWDVATGMAKLLEGHGDAVNSVAFSSTGEIVVSASSDHNVRIWDAATGEVKMELKAHTASVNSVSFSPDGRHIVSASDDQTVRLWSTESGQEERRMDGHMSMVDTASFSHDGRRIVSGSRDQTMIVWNRADGKKELILDGHNGWIRSASFTSDDKFLVSAGSDWTVRLWDVIQSEGEVQPQGHTLWVNTAALSPDGTHIVSVGGDRVLRLWDAMTGVETMQLVGHNKTPMTALYSSDGQRIVSAALDGTVRVWNVRSGEEEMRLEGHTDRVNSAQFCAEGDYIVSASDDKTVRMWSLATQQEEKQFNGHTAAVNWASFFPDSQRIVSASDDCTVRVWDVQTREEMRLLKGHNDSVRSAAFSHDGKMVVSGSWDGSICVWDVTTKTIPAPIRLPGHTNKVTSVVFSADDKRIASRSWDRTACVWDVARMELDMRLEGHLNVVTTAFFSQDGKRLVTASDDRTVQVWNVAADETPVDTRSQWMVDDQGWVIFRDKPSERVMWLSHAILGILRRPRCDLVISRSGCLAVDFAGASLGPQWAECYAPSM